MDKVKVGIIGCGNISKAYLNNCTKYNNLEVVACADLDLTRAQERATEYGVPIACSPEELLANKEIEIVINLTIPKAHAEVCLLALNAGKHVYTEKPFTVTREEGLSILEKAKEKGLLVASAPETFMGGDGRNPYTCNGYIRVCFWSCGYDHHKLRCIRGSSSS